MAEKAKAQRGQRSTDAEELRRRRQMSGTATGNRWTLMTINLEKNEKPRPFGRGFVLAIPIFPGSHPPSIVGAHELNFCVRDENRWTLMAIITNLIFTERDLLLS